METQPIAQSPLHKGIFRTNSRKLRKNRHQICLVLSNFPYFCYFYKYIKQKIVEFLIWHCKIGFS